MVTDAKNATALNDRGKFPQTDMQAHGPKAPDDHHTFASRLVMAGVDLRTVRQPVGADREVARGTVVQDTDNITRRGGRARLKASDSKSDRGASPSGVQILSPPPN